MESEGSGQVTDRELLLRVAAGDVDAFDTLHRRWRPSLIGYFRHRQVSTDDAEELADECLEVVWQRRHTYQPTPQPGGAWIFGIARRLLARHRRRRAAEARAVERFTVVIDLTDDSGTDAIADRVDAQTTIPHLQAALRALPPSERDAVLLRVIHQHTYREIATSLGCSEAAARQRVSRGLRRLHTLLTDPIA